MELKGKIIAVLPMKSGKSAKGDWKSQQYVLETDEKYPKRLLFDVFGENKINEFNIQKDVVVNVSFETRAEEHEGHWYGSNRAWNVTRD